MEKVYENALAEELRDYGLIVEQQKPVIFFYKGKSVGEFIADMVVNNIVFLEIKAVKSLTEEFEAKLLQYLKATGMEVGLLPRLPRGTLIGGQVKRKVFTKPSATKSAES